jgi:hypothetical protein
MSTREECGIFVVGVAVVTHRRRVIHRIVQRSWHKRSRDRLRGQLIGKRCHSIGEILWRYILWCGNELG